MHVNFLSAPIVSDDEIEATLSDTALADAMIRCEVALARAQAKLGVIPEAAARAIADTGARFAPPMADLRDGVAQNGVPIPALLSHFRDAIGKPHADWLHWGATSQDIIDSALGITYNDTFAIIRQRLSSLLDALETFSARTARIPMAGRTRGQLAVPITLGLRCARWAQPLVTLEAEAGAIAKAAFRVQLGGAAGSRSVIHPHGPAIASAMADDLGLEDSLPWHTDRSGLSRLANWLSRILSALGKLAADLITSGRGEIAELGTGSGGGSSTMPHKSNPVMAEAILTLVTFCRGLAATLDHAAIHGEERDGPAWTVEWLVMPNLLVGTGAALAKAQALVGSLTFSLDALSGRLGAHPELFAEAAVFALGQEHGREAATGLVRDMLAKGEDLATGVAQHLSADHGGFPDSDALVESAAAEAELVFLQRVRGDK